MTQLTPPTSNVAELATYARQLRHDTMAVRVHHEKMGVRRALTRDQVDQAAQSFDADAKAINASKRLIDTRHPAYRDVLGVRRRATQYWKAVTIPYPEPGVRLLRRDNLEQFDKQMHSYQVALTEKVAALQACYEELRERARKQLGSLFNIADYPERLDHQFALCWDYPSIEPPAYLKQIHPELYEQECERIRVRFEEAVALTEQAFVSEFNKLVAHLADRLSGEIDGKPKIFRDSAIENLNSFFATFRSLNVGSNGELNALVDAAQQAMAGVQPEDLRGNDDVRQAVQSQLANIQRDLDSMMVDRPRRAISLEDEEEGGVQG
jgi:hypothetical protein